MAALKFKSQIDVRQSAGDRAQAETKSSQAKKKDRLNRAQKPVVEEMAPLLVLLLKPDLPVGRITRDHGIECLLALVAESFGVPVRCHPDEPLNTLYSGPFGGNIGN